MPKGPQGQKRPADVIGAAIRVVKIATGEEEDEEEEKSSAAELGSKGGKQRAAKLSAARRKEIARNASKIRWAARSPDPKN